MIQERFLILFRKIFAAGGALIVFLTLFGCGGYAISKNNKALRDFEKGTPRAEFVEQLSDPMGGAKCIPIGLIENSSIESCSYILTLNLYGQFSDNNIFFYKDKFVGSGRTNLFFSEYIKEVSSNPIYNNDQSLLLINRITPPATTRDFFTTGIPASGLQVLDVYVNGKLIGKLGHEGAVLWDQRSGDEIKLEIVLAGKVIKSANLTVDPGKIYTLNYDPFSTGSLRLDGDEQSVIEITSTPPGAMIYSGSPSERLNYTGYKTPHAWHRQALASSWANESYQVQLEGYLDSETISKNSSFGNRKIHFVLEKKPVSPPQLKVAVTAPPVTTSPVPDKPKEKYVVYTGTGWVTQSGYIVTNFHVIEGQVETKVRFNGLGAETYPAEIVLSDKYNDLAILKLASNDRAPVPGLPISAKLPKLGGDVFTIGYPKSSVMGRNPKVTNGIVSSLSGLRDDPRIIQTTVAIQSGNSGGPLIDMQGKVVGVTTSSLKTFITDSGIDVPQSVNYAVKSAYVLALMSSLPEISDYPMVVLTSSKLENMVPAVQDSIVQIIVQSKEK